jgi:hypothetical protein
MIPDTYDILKPPKKYGWVCPKCEGVMSPVMFNCTYCKPLKKEDGNHQFFPTPTFTNNKEKE